MTFKQPDSLNTCTPSLHSVTSDIPSSYANCSMIAWQVQHRQLRGARRDYFTLHTRKRFARQHMETSLNSSLSRMFPLRGCLQGCNGRSLLCLRVSVVAALPSSPFRAPGLARSVRWACCLAARGGARRGGAGENPLMVRPRWSRTPRLGRITVFTSGSQRRGRGHP